MLLQVVRRVRAAEALPVVSDLQVLAASVGLGWAVFPPEVDRQFLEAGEEGEQRFDVPSDPRISGDCSARRSIC